LSIFASGLTKQPITYFEFENLTLIKRFRNTVFKDRKESIPWTLQFLSALTTILGSGVATIRRQVTGKAAANKSWKHCYRASIQVIWTLLGKLSLH
jgi:hypothetical protein